MNRRDRDRRPARGPATREVRRRILVVCEGAVTEPKYFRGFADRWRNPRVDLFLPRKLGSPLALVEQALSLRKDAKTRARAERDDNAAFDEVCVCTMSTVTRV